MHLLVMCRVSFSIISNVAWVMKCSTELCDAIFPSLGKHCDRAEKT